MSLLLVSLVELWDLQRSSLSSTAKFLYVDSHSHCHYDYLSHSLTHSLSNSLSLSPTHSFIQQPSLTHSLTHSLSLTVNLTISPIQSYPHLFTLIHLSLPLILSHISLTHSLSFSLTVTLTISPIRSYAYLFTNPPSHRSLSPTHCQPISLLSSLLSHRSLSPTHSHSFLSHIPYLLTPTLFSPISLTHSLSLFFNPSLPSLSLSLSLFSSQGLRHPDLDSNQGDDTEEEVEEAGETVGEHGEEPVHHWVCREQQQTRSLTLDVHVLRLQCLVCLFVHVCLCLVIPAHRLRTRQHKCCWSKNNQKQTF